MRVADYSVSGADCIGEPSEYKRSGGILGFRVILGIYWDD